ncbi:hypothetical protein VN97_g2572 [Penicillium thymicola]|uniref:Uncharacterized protein n=1 Tax=Penicillium thymicola TaxID=293382 RepID=A0AAI9TNX4_PENTH|nr:hypothetical protein VN97_g2572 [Penicillium thymicola]
MQIANMHVWISICIVEVAYCIEYIAMILNSSFFNYSLCNTIQFIFSSDSIQIQFTLEFPIPILEGINFNLII